MLAPSSDDGVVVVDDRLVGKCTSRRTSSRCSNPSRMVPMRWPVPSEWSAVATGLRLALGRVEPSSATLVFPICGIKPFVTQMSHILTQRAYSTYKSSHISHAVHPPSAPGFVWA